MQQFFLSLLSGLSETAAAVLRTRPPAVISSAISRLRRKKLAELLSAVPKLEICFQDPQQDCSSAEKPRSGNSSRSKNIPPPPPAILLIRNGSGTALQIDGRFTYPSAPYWAEPLIARLVLIALRSERFKKLSDGESFNPAEGPPEAALLYSRLQNCFEPEPGPNRVESKTPAAIAKLPLRRPPISAPAAGGSFNLQQCWIQLRKEYFPERSDLDRYRLSWTRRATSAMLGCCDVNKRAVRVAAILDRPDCFRYLPALLYHEMCHAVLGKPRIRDGRRVIHGTDFKQLERRHPGIQELDRWIKTGGWHAVAKEAKRKRA